LTEVRPLLEIQELSVRFQTEDGVARAVDGVSFDVGQSETFCLVGESGCGKSVTALSIMGLIPSPAGEIVSGRILFEGDDVLLLSPRQMRAMRGSRLSMVFQEPMTSLNPVLTVGYQVVESLRVHQGVRRHDARVQAADILDRVGIPDARQCMRMYPHQMSGGMQQRVMIAMALACRPSMLIADEPTTALDVTIQAQILDLLRNLQRSLGMSVLLITHDLGVVAELGDQVGVMYAGSIVECGDVMTVFRRPLHPYTIGLLMSRPVIGSGKSRLNVIPGHVPDPHSHPSGCRFHPRCSMAVPACSRIVPELREFGAEHRAACIRLAGYWQGQPPSDVAIADSAEAWGGPDA